MRGVVAGVLLAVSVAPGSSVRAWDGGPNPDDVPLRIRVIDTDGLEWRERAWSRLDLLDRKTAAVWATDARTLGLIVGSAARLVTRSTGHPGGGPQKPNTINYVAWLHRQADGPPGQATAVAFAPVAGTVEDGTDVMASGRRQGEEIRVTVSIRDSRLLAIHGVSASDSVGGRRGNGTTIRGAMQVPEVVTARAEGSWTIGAGEALVVSLGVSSFPGPTGTGRVPRERLVVIDALDLDEPAFEAGRASVVKRSASRSSLLGLLFPGAVSRGGFGVALVTVVSCVVSAVVFLRPRSVAGRPGHVRA